MKEDKQSWQFEKLLFALLRTVDEESAIFKKFYDIGNYIKRQDCVAIKDKMSQRLVTFCFDSSLQWILKQRNKLILSTVRIYEVIFVF